MDNLHKDRDRDRDRDGPDRDSAAAAAADDQLMEQQGVLLTDILGIEDYFGDMDFKMAGSRDGLTAVQLDIKRRGLPLSVLGRAIEKGRPARLHILDCMANALAAPRIALKPTVPLFQKVEISGVLKGALIGVLGSNIRHIERETGATVVVDEEQDFAVVYGMEEEVAAARKLVLSAAGIMDEYGTYNAVVIKVMETYAIVELDCGEFTREALLHVTDYAVHRTRLQDVLAAGQTLQVKAIGNDERGKLRVSRKALLPTPTSDEANATATATGSGNVTHTSTSPEHNAKPFVSIPLKVGEVYRGVVQDIRQYGVMLNIHYRLQLLHVSKLSDRFLMSAEQSGVKVGDAMEVICVGHRPDGRPMLDRWPPLANPLPYRKPSSSSSSPPPFSSAASPIQQQEQELDPAMSAAFAPNGTPSASASPPPPPPSP